MSKVHLKKKNVDSYEPFLVLSGKRITIFFLISGSIKIRWHIIFWHWIDGFSWNVMWLYMLHGILVTLVDNYYSCRNRSYPGGQRFLAARFVTCRPKAGRCRPRPTNERRVFRVGHNRDGKDFKIRRLRTTRYGWTRVFRCLGYWTEYTTNGAKIPS